jgi:hypothetical protein
MSSSRVGLAVTVVLTLGVMGAMVAWGLRERAREDEAKTRPGWRGTGLGRVASDREFEMPDGCEVDPKRPPKAVFDLKDDRLDVGAMRQGQVLEREVVLRNVGSGPLCLSRPPDTGCGCVRAALEGDDRLIPPTGTATIRVTVDVGTREGLQDKEVRLYTNDPARRVAIFRVVADVRLGVVLQDPAPTFGQPMRHRESTAVVRLKSPVGEPPWEVTGVEGTNATYGFDVSPGESSDPAFRVVAVRLRHPGSDRLGPQTDTIKIRTSHPDHREIVVHSRMTVVDKYFASPTRLPMGVLAAEAQGSWQTLRVLPADPKGAVPFAGASVESGPFEVDDPRPGRDGEWVLRVRAVPREASSGTVEGTLVVRLDDPDLPELRVPLSVVVLGRVGRTGIRPPTSDGR